MWLWGYGQPCCPGLKSHVSANASESGHTEQAGHMLGQALFPGGAGWSIARHVGPGSAARAGMGRGWPGPGGLGAWEEL